MDPTRDAHYRPADTGPTPTTVFALFSDAHNPDYGDRGSDVFLGVFATEAAAHAEIARLALAGEGIERARVERTEVQG